jgi:hypothetical protein
MVMIRFVMPSLTIFRLRQVTALKRTGTELVDALKGRIVSLPVDVQANADIQPEKILKIDSFVAIVNGQPTYKKNVWTALIDLSKLHEELLWL